MALTPDPLELPNPDPPEPDPTLRKGEEDPKEEVLLPKPLASAPTGHVNAVIAANITNDACIRLMIAAP
jgi:hypothetical protein